MLKRIVEWSLRYRGTVLVMALLLAVYGAFITRQIKFDVFPEFAPPLIVIQTEATGLSPDEVEILVTRPIETELNGTPELQNLYSQSIQGLSVVTAVFHDNTDILRARQLISERLVEVGGKLPHGVSSPRMGPLTSSTSLVLVLGLVSNERTPMEVRTFADWTVRLALLGVPGVARIEVFGGEVRQIQVQVNPDRLLAYGLALDDVLASARKATGVRGAGFIENENQRIVLRTKGQALTPEDVGEAVVGHHNGVSVRLKDVAQVVEAAEPKLGDAQVMGTPGVVLLVHSQYGANTLEVTRAVETALGEMRPWFAVEKVTLHPQLFRPANFIEASIRNVNRSFLLSGLLVGGVLYFFLANLRSAFIAFTTIPLSLLTAIIVLDWRGISLNTITLGGFAISIGVVVDDAIIGLENVWRRLRENAALPVPKSSGSVVLNATLEVRTPIVYATVIVAAVFWPVLIMSGINGRLFAPLALAFILATLASLVMAITLTPALCLLMLAPAKAHGPRYLGWLKRLHARCLHAVSRWPKSVVGATTLLCAGAAAALPFFGGEFLPEFKEGHYIIHLLAAPGTSIPASLRMGTALTRELMKNPRIRSISQEIGRAEQGEDTSGPEYSELHVELKPLSGENMKLVKDEIRAVLEKFPGVNFSITPFLVERMEEVLSGGRGEVVINVFGNDLEQIDQHAQAIRDLIADISGAKDVMVSAQSGAPEVTISLRREQLRQFGFEAVDVLDTLQAAYQGTVVAEAYDNNRVFEVAVILNPASRQAPETLADLQLRNAAGLRLPLRELAEIGPSSGRSVIFHEGTRRRQQVTCEVEGRDAASFVSEVKRVIAAKLSVPPGISVSCGGAAEASSNTQNDLLFHTGIAAVVIILLLSMVLANGRNLLLVLANLPFALAGGVLTGYLAGGSLSIGSLVGFVSLFGISMRNSILMICHYETLVAEEGMPWGLETAIRGATERLLPILMTALVVALGLLPIALGHEQAGKEIEGPMAIVILGGLLTSTALNLLVLPTLALRYGKFGKRESLC
jgi:CzcA family heavy metal efflux pump